VRSKVSKRLQEAGSPFPVGTFLLMRAAFMFVLTPLALLYIFRTSGFTAMGILLMVFATLALPQLPSLYIKRKARKRTKEIERAMPDALDLLVVCVEGGLSLDGGVQQVSQRTQGVLATEFQRLLSEVATGMARREALQGLAGRSASQSLSALCATVIQADKMGVSIATSLRTLAETLRTQRRQAAETQARKAPIKMLPFIVFFMLPALFIVILAPIAVGFMEMMRGAGT
jgi:tight adherence protein C